ncbi:M1 family metallopeptidase [Wenyingzhuangia marina]|uniref:Peptidase family M1 n=1 Tax=Wenyingzhuangia marina TaxID=1195760 RepID=A0A1M5W7A4_9FLAO|nr:M1 family metallopeptidase [Wenyingzhuangia marina]SHH83064.1 Peptidase family M1 [Wenyingzhuangia marina]
MYKFVFFCIFVCNILYAQNNFSQQDTLRGSITPERAWWDVINYTLDIHVFPKTKSIKGSNTITYNVLKPHQKLQIELQPPLVIDSIIQNKQKLSHYKIGFSYFINLIKKQKVNTSEKITIYYHGKPKEAIKAPWDGGIVWSKDQNGNDFIATANQSIGSSIWWPCKDHPADEAENMQITVTCPDPLMDVSNGRKIKTKKNKDNTTSYTWKVINPINNYGVSLNIANYDHFSETYKGEKGNLDCNYYVISTNLKKAKEHFKDVPKMLKAFEYWFGPYPFYEDGYKLVETPYLGMEHQSCVAYGNNYLKGYLGYPMGTSEWGKKFDFIIIHESGHEWFANNITCKDVADLWIHEAFTSYSEALFVDYHYGIKAGNEYAQGQRALVKNDRPIIGTYNVHHEGSSDMYPKGSLMLHTLRQIINNDKKWRNILRGLNNEFHHQTVTGNQVIEYINKKVKMDLTSFFKQYLSTTKIPTLLVEKRSNYIYYAWENVVDDFNIPIKIYLDNKEKWIYPKEKEWKKISGKYRQFKVDKNFYIMVKEI